MMISVNYYILYYNTERQQEKLKELTPITYRKLALSVQGILFFIKAVRF